MTPDVPQRPESRGREVFPDTVNGEFPRIRPPVGEVLLVIALVAMAVRWSGVLGGVRASALTPFPVQASTPYPTPVVVVPIYNPECLKSQALCHEISCFWREGSWISYLRVWGLLQPCLLAEWTAGT